MRDFEVLKLEECINVLTQHSAYRVGLIESKENYSPKEIGDALFSAIAHLIDYALIEPNIIAAVPSLKSMERVRFNIAALENLDEGVGK